MLLWLWIGVYFMRLRLDLALVETAAGFGWTSVKQAQTEQECP